MKYKFTKDHKNSFEPYSKERDSLGRILNDFNNKNEIFNTNPYSD